MFESIWLDAAALFGFIHLAAPLAVRATFRFSAKCQPKLVAPEDLPQTAAQFLVPGIPKIQRIGFDFLGCYDCGEMAAHTRSYIAYFCNRRTNDFANLSAVVSSQGAAGYLEFSTRFKDGSAIETNTNGVLPLTPGHPGSRIFRLPEIQDEELLFTLHRSFIEKYAGQLLSVGESQGQEISRVVRVMENYGPRHAAIGYMKLSPDAASYRLTWKGACLMAWRALWPTSPVRKLLYKTAIHEEIRSLEVGGETALLKA